MIECQFDENIVVRKPKKKVKSYKESELKIVDLEENALRKNQYSYKMTNSSFNRRHSSLR